MSISIDSRECDQSQRPPLPPGRNNFSLYDQLISGSSSVVVVIVRDDCASKIINACNLTQSVTKKHNLQK